MALKRRLRALYYQENENRGDTLELKRHGVEHGLGVTYTAELAKMAIGSSSTLGPLIFSTQRQQSAGWISTRSALTSRGLSYRQLCTSSRTEIREKGWMLLRVRLQIWEGS